LRPGRNVEEAFAFCNICICIKYYTYNITL
jgi:hypothetical protein